MSNAPRSGPGNRPSWRQNRPAASTSPGRKRVLRVVLSLATAALLGMFAWWLWPGQVHRLSVAVLTIEGSDLLQTPRLAAVGGLAKEFEPLKTPPYATVDVMNRKDLSEAKILEDELGAELASLAPPDSVDTLVVVVAAQGVAWAPKGKPPSAWLLTSTFNAADDDGRGSGRFRFADLLAAVRQYPAKTRLLVVDSGNISCDPRSGMIVNEFPRLAQTEVRAVGDPDLWVLMSNDVMETSHVSARDGWRFFPHFVARGLAGDANTDNDKKIDLDELKAYVAQRVGGWVWNATDQNATQTPVLVQAVASKSQTDPEKVFIAVDRRSDKPAEQAPAKSKGEKTAALKAQTPSDSPFARGRVVNALTGGGLALWQAEATDPATAPVKDQTPEEAAKAAAGSKPPAGKADSNDPTPAGGDAPAKTAKDKGQPPSEKGSTKRGTLTKQPPKTGKGAPAQSPAGPSRVAKDFDRIFGPAWKEHAQRGDRSQAIWVSVDFAPHLCRQYEERLLAVERDWAAWPNRPMKKQMDELAGDVERLQSELRDRLELLRIRFESSSVKEQYERHPDLEQAVMLRNDLTHRAPLLIRWLYHRGAAIRRGDEEELRADLTDLLDGLARLTADLGGQNSDTEDWLGKLQGHVAALTELRGRFDSAIRQQAEDLLAKESLAERDRIAAEALLMLPQLAVEDRRDLHERLAAAAKSNAAKPNAATLNAAIKLPKASQVADLRDRDWERAYERAAWEAKLVLVIDSDSESALNAVLTRELEAASGSDSQRHWKSYQEIGSRLAGYYGSFRRRALSDAESDEPARQLTAESMFRLLDARDFSDDMDILVCARLPERDLPDSQLSLAGPASGQGASGSLAIRSGTSETFEWRLTARRSPVKSVDVSAQYDPEVVEVLGPDGRSADGSTWTVPLPARDVNMTIKLQVKAKRETGETASLTLHVRGTEQPLNDTATFVLPQPELLEIAIGPSRFVSRQMQDGKDTATLEPFPTGKTEFLLQIQNGSARGKKADFAWIALPPPGPYGRREWDSPWQDAAAKTLRAGCRELLRQELTLPGSGTVSAPLPPELMPKAAPAPAVAGAAPETATAPAGAAEPGLDISNGLVCMLDDRSGPLGRQLVWINARPRHPEQYLQPPNVFYEKAARRIRIEVEPIDTQFLPPGGSRVEWPFGKELQNEVNETTITAEKTGVPLSAILTSAANSIPGGILPIRLRVDGYPRAFVYRVFLDGAGGKVERTRDTLHEIRITSPPDGVPMKAPETLEVRLEVDAPPDAFRQDKQYVAIVTLRDPATGNERERVQRYADRDVRVVMRPGALPNTFALETEVSDLSVDLDTAGYADRKMILSAELSSAGKGGERQRIELNLDGAPPEVEPLVGVNTALRVMAGTTAPLEVRATDKISGVARVEFDFKGNVPGMFAMPLTVSHEGIQDDIYRIDLPTGERGPGTYVVEVRAFDQVGQVSAIEELSIRIIPKSTAGDTKDGKSLNNKLVIKVVHNKRKVSQFSVKVEGPKAVTAASENGSPIELKNLPPGDYKLEITATASGKNNRSGTANVTVESPPAEPASVEIDVD